MKQSEFALVVKSGAVARVTIFRDRKSDGQWSIFGYGSEGSIGWERDWIETSRDRSAREWASLDTAHAWIRKQGWIGTVTIDG